MKTPNITNTIKEPMSLESALGWQQEAITPYEKCLARHLVAALHEIEKLKQWRDLALAIGQREEERIAERDER